jgi:hypothetical protein
VEKQQFTSELRMRASTKVKLNVGRVFITTSITTLMSKPDSMLAAMFSRHHKLKKDNNNWVFINCNSKLFKYVLQYLHDSDLDTSDLSLGVKKRLKHEAAFYCLPKLEEKLSAGGPVDSNLPPQFFWQVFRLNSCLCIAGPDPLGIKKNLHSLSQDMWDSLVWDKWVPKILQHAEQFGYSMHVNGSLRVNEVNLQFIKQ